MKAKCENKEVVEKFLSALKKQREYEIQQCEKCMEEHGCCPNVGYCYNDGSVLVKDIYGGIAIARSAYAESEGTKEVIGYITCSGKGKWWVENGILWFEGYRNSFKGGCEVFTPSPDDGWELVESSQPERGVWE